ncbi:aldo/keto reductase [Alteromonas gilva]|uniref:Aldo/keto reductase n=1 Tax=Alteromonas gilva TaxID=2987522 RepID=A0ABT5L164_9ALTE|nr:aldo/keto reductase [Alteromonas gilva]MDC8830770.1 aldo/keto reductase [Alteromonas gilva]
MSAQRIKSRILGSSALKVSEVGLGCWQLGGDFGPIDEQTAMAVLTQAVDDGITFFDTADVYGGGQSESYLGKVLSDIAPDAVIATKYGRGEGTYPDGYSLTDLRDAVKRAQDRLQRDRLDLLQLHCIPKHVLSHGAIFDWLREVQQEGHISHFGASVETLEEAHICLQHDDVASLQIIFNLMRQRPVTELFDKALEKKVGIIVRLPLASGMLTGKFDQNTQFDATDHRNFNKDGDAFSVGETFSGIEFNQGLKLIERLKTFKPDDLTMAQFAMRWILDHDAVSAIIPGASSAKQVSQNAAVSALSPLDKRLHEQLYAYYIDEVEPLIRCEV